MFRRTFSLFAVFAVALAIGYLLIKLEPAQETDNFELPFAASAQSADAETADKRPIEEMVIGDPDAPLTIIEYASFTCPHCASFHEKTYLNLTCPPKGPKAIFLGFWGSGLAPQITKNRKNVAPKRPQRRPRKKHTISHHFWVGPALENEAPV